MMDDFSYVVKKCLGILEENVEILASFEFDLEDELTPCMKPYQLYNMAEDIAESSKLKRAESNFMRRQSEDFL